MLAGKGLREFSRDPDDSIRVDDPHHKVTPDWSRIFGLGPFGTVRKSNSLRALRMLILLVCAVQLRCCRAGRALGWMLTAFLWGRTQDGMGLASMPLHDERIALVNHLLPRS